MSSITYKHHEGRTIFVLLCSLLYIQALGRCLEMELLKYLLNERMGIWVDRWVDG